jgi:predicted dehydrogenase
MSEKIKIGVIGTGHLGSIHTKLWKTHKEIELVGIYDNDTEKAKEVANENDCKIFDSIEQTLNECDAVTIATPTSTHFEVAIESLKHNVHCFIEKPITENYNEAVKLIEKAKEKNVLIQVGHVERFNSALASLKKYNLQPMFIEAHRLAQFKPRATDVSVIHDLMIHDIDIMLWLVGSKVIKIDANGVAILTEKPDIANARITFENGAVANLTASRISAKPMRKMRIFQKQAYISIDFGNQDVEVFRILSDDDPNAANAIPATMLGLLDKALHNKRIVYEKPEVKQGNAIFDEQKAFLEAINKKAPVAVSAHEAAEALRIAELINSQVKNSV